MNAFLLLLLHINLQQLIQLKSCNLDTLGESLCLCVTELLGAKV